MNKRGMTRKSVEVKQKITVLKVPETKAKSVPEMYVVHSIPDQQKVVFSSYGPAFKMFKEKSGKTTGSVALWHKKGGWTRVNATPYYPEKLTEPYLSESYKVQS